MLVRGLHHRRAKLSTSRADSTCARSQRSRSCRWTPGSHPSVTVSLIFRARQPPATNGSDDRDRHHDQQQPTQRREHHREDVRTANAPQDERPGVLKQRPSSGVGRPTSSERTGGSARRPTRGRGTGSSGTRPRYPRRAGEPGRAGATSRGRRQLSDTPTRKPVSPRITKNGWYSRSATSRSRGAAAPQLGERDRDLQPGQRRADAEVHAAAEADVGAVAAADVERVRVGEPGRVAVGRPEQHADPIADPQPPPGDLDAVVEHPPFEHLQRPVPADHLLDGDGRLDLAGDDPLPLRRDGVSSARMPLPRVLTVASCPALSSTMTVQTISSSVSRSPWSATCDQLGDQVRLAGRAGGPRSAPGRSR